MCDFYNFGQECHDDCSLKLPTTVVSAPVTEQPVTIAEPQPVEEPVAETPVIIEEPVFVPPQAEEPVFVHGEHPKLE
jgi:hypothetical protein